MSELGALPAASPAMVKAFRALLQHLEECRNCRWQSTLGNVATYQPCTEADALKALAQGPATAPPAAAAP